MSLPPSRLFCGGRVFSRWGAPSTSSQCGGVLSQTFSVGEQEILLLLIFGGGVSSPLYISDYLTCEWISAWSVPACAASKVGHRMAQSEYENEPNFVRLGNLGTFSSDQIISNLESSVIEQSLSDVAALFSIGDTKISVPGRIKGKLKVFVIL